MVFGGRESHGMPHPSFPPITHSGQLNWLMCGV